MIGHPVLRKIVRANAFITFSRAHLGFALGGIHGVFFGHLPFQQPRAEHGHGARFVFLLRSLICTTDDQTAGLMDDLDRAVGRVNALSAGA